MTPFEQLAPRPRSRPCLVTSRPKLASAELVTPTELRLTFTEPVSPVGDFDPEQFRLSIAGRYFDDGDGAAYYYDVGAAAEPPFRARFVRVTAQDESTLRLLLDRPIPTDVCEDVQEIQHEAGEDPAVEGGLYLHYADRPGGGIGGDQHRRLAPIADHWVLNGAEEAQFYGRVRKMPRAFGPIPCELSNPGAG